MKSFKFEMIDPNNPQSPRYIEVKFDYVNQNIYTRLPTDPKRVTLTMVSQGSAFAEFDQAQWEEFISACVLIGHERDEK